MKPEHERPVDSTLAKLDKPIAQVPGLNSLARQGKAIQDTTSALFERSPVEAGIDAVVDTVFEGVERVVNSVGKVISRDRK